MRKLSLFKTTEKDLKMNQSNNYVPPKVWVNTSQNGGTFANINKPTAGSSYEETLPVGKHPLQLYSMATPNGIKVSIMLEELLALGHTGAEYDAWLSRIHKGEQFSSGFVGANPNSKIPVLVDHSFKSPQRIFESGAILFYLAEKFGELLPTTFKERTECLSWLFWQMGSAPYLGGGFGHFYKYAPKKSEYAIDRLTMETKRQLDVLDQRLAKENYISGSDYTIADIAIWSWYGQLVLGELYDADKFLNVKIYKNVIEWAKKINYRSAVIRGKMVNRTSGNLATQLHERHSSSDFELRNEAVLKK